jgi:hypothetical protein
MLNVHCSTPFLWNCEVRCRQNTLHPEGGRMGIDVRNVTCHKVLKMCHTFNYLALLAG